MSDAYDNFEGGLNALLEDSIELNNRHVEKEIGALKKTSAVMDECANLIHHVDAQFKYLRECKHVLVQNFLTHMPAPHQLEADDPLPRIAQKPSEDAISRAVKSVHDERHPFMKRIA